MKKQAKKLIPILIAVVFIFCVHMTAYAAETLPDGSVKGLPERLVVLDDKGQSVSDSGDYFFVVENMQAGETYSKKIQLMNLREDASYKITFKAEPLTKKGEIDLENECVCEIFLDGKEIYSGKVTGEGTPDIRDNAMSLGTYQPGESHIMKVNVKWNGTSAGGFIDNGKRIVDKNGTSVVREKSGQNEISGEITFKWSFYAEVYDNSGEESTITVSEVTDPESPSQPGGGTESSYYGASSYDGSQIHSKPSGGKSIIDFVQTGEVVVWTAIIIILAATSILIFLLVGKKKKQKSDS